MNDMNFAIRLIYAFLLDPEYNFNYFNRDKTTSNGKPWEIMSMQQDYQMGWLLNNIIEIRSARSTGKTSSVSSTVFRHVMAYPNKKTAYIVKNEKHMNSFVMDIESYFMKDDFTRLFYIGFSKKERIFRFTNGHTIEIRVAGHDKTGAVSMVALHVDFMIIDEAQLLENTILQELVPGRMEGNKMIIAGVPNNFRDTILYHYATKDYVTQYHYTSLESFDWDESKEREALELYGSKESINYQNLVLGTYCDASTAVFKPSKVVENIKDDIDFKYVEYNGNKFEELLSKIELPLLKEKYDFYIIGADMGYTNRSPMHISVLGKYTKKMKIDDDRIEKDVYDCIMRLNVAIDSAPEAAKLFNFLIEYFNCRHIALDGQNYGNAIYTNLTHMDLFPNTYKINENYIMSLLFGTPIVTGQRKVTDPGTGIETTEDVTTTIKIASTDHLANLIDEGRFFISSDDAGTCEHMDLVTILQSEAQKFTKNKLHSRQYSNSQNEHATDSLRCCSYVIKMVVEGGINFKDNRQMLAPIKLKSSPYKRNKRKGII